MTKETQGSVLRDLFSAPEHAPFVLEGGPGAALLIHGFPGTPAEVRPLAEALHLRGWTVQAPLLPGFGPQLPQLAQTRREDWLQAISRSARDLRQRSTFFALIGYSMGGALALAAAESLRPDALVLLCPFTGFSGVAWALLPLFRRIGWRIRPFRSLGEAREDPRLRQALNGILPGLNLDDPAVRAELRAYTVPWALLDELRQLGRAAQRAVARLTAPLLVIQGLKDPVVSPARTRRLLLAYSGPVHYLEVLAGHELLDPGGPAWPQVVETITRFLEQVSA